MAGRSHRHATKHAAHRLFSESASTGFHDSDEFTESDVWGCPVEPAPRQAEPGGRAIPSFRPSARGRKADGQRGDRVPPASLPVNIPDWSKILGNCANSHGKNSSGFWGEEEEEEEVIDGDELDGRRMVPPHELLWRSRAASMSVHEGIGRTLKGRDLSRVRNAVWQITGFED
uniref:Senescence regulator n=1 Tax=Musa acuminata subsp. malaccensis TaxID=214687 RepID=A0A804J4F1_MUSAM|nr:PREDICTED: uncharacterized protein LOC103984958 [Musa acuminata subsp. malaccensis]